MPSTLRKTQTFLVPFLVTQKLLIRWTIGVDIISGQAVASEDQVPPPPP